LFGRCPKLLALGADSTKVTHGDAQPKRLRPMSQNEIVRMAVIWKVPSFGLGFPSNSAAGPKFSLFTPFHDP
jgi:hypothetical protein